MRRILRAPAPPRDAAPPCDAPTLNAIHAVFTRARGNAVRMQELLGAEHGLSVSYSTLTRWLRHAGLRSPPPRVGEYHFAPGEETQHDTSPHRVTIAGHIVTVQCAASILACSRWLFCQYYPRYTRFEAKHFLREAACAMDGVCPRCVIDNTSVILAGGSGEDAVIAPEMAAFARALGFAFHAHRVGDPDRKGRIERSFLYIETNFLPGRSFADFDDLNAQARTWCREVANAKPKRALGMAPHAAYLIEKPHLQPLPSVLPPVYDVMERTVDWLGFVSLDTNRYSVPERHVGQPVTVYKYPATVAIVQRGTTLATHPRLVGQRDARHTLPGHHTVPARTPRQPPPEEQHLRGHHPILDRYVAELKQRAHGRGVRALRRLLALKRTYPSAPFIAALTQALDYGLYDLHRLDALILKHVAGDFFALNERDDDA